MLLFLASVIEQLDLALEQISKGDVHYARFGMMLTDNAVELILHQIAKTRRQISKCTRGRKRPTNIRRHWITHWAAILMRK